MKVSEQNMVIAIDGFSACGKSTLAKQLAKHLNCVFVDSGAMYRATTLFFLDHQINLDDAVAVKKSLENIHIHFQNINGRNTTFLNSKNVEAEIRSLRVSSYVSEVAALSTVRKEMVRLQRQMQGNECIIMDGRDIGTVVFPTAQFKFFITARPEVRAQRRYHEDLLNVGSADYNKILENLQHRDKIDTERSDSPLRQAEDAVLIDNSDLTIQEQFELVLSIILQK